LSKRKPGKKATHAEAILGADAVRPSDENVVVFCAPDPADPSREVEVMRLASNGSIFITGRHADNREAFAMLKDWLKNTK
jgi:hypothetical protein